MLTMIKALVNMLRHNVEWSAANAPTDYTHAGYSPAENREIALKHASVNPRFLQTKKIIVRPSEQTKTNPLSIKSARKVYHKLC